MKHILGAGREDVRTASVARRAALCVCAALLLLSDAAQAATGDIAQIAISADGSQVTFTIEGMNGDAIKGFEAGKSATLHMTSVGYSETVPTPFERNTQTLFRSASGNSPATVTLDLVEWVHANDTALVFDVDPNAFSDGTNLSAGLAGGSAANGSTLAYGAPTVAIVSEALTKHSDAFYVDVYACGPAYTGHRSELGIAAVCVEVTDAGGAGKSVTKTATAMQLIDRIGSYGWQNRWQAFRVGPFNPDSGGDWGAEGATLGLAKVVAKAYPRIGDDGSVRSSEAQHVFLDKDDVYEVRHAVVNPVSGDNTTGKVGVGDGGFHGGADQVDSAAKSSPYRDINAAISACQRGDGATAGPGHGKASWSVVYLAPGSHILGRYSYGARTDTRDGPVILTRLPSAAREEVVITGSLNSCGLRTNALWLEDLRIAASGDCVLRTKSQVYSPAGPLGDLEYLKVRNCDLVGTGRADAKFSQWTEGFDKVFVYAISCTESRRPLASIRDSFYFANGEGFSADRNNLVFANHDISIDASGLAAPAHVLRLFGGNENVVFHNNHIRNIANVYPAPHGRGNGRSVSRFAMTFNVQEADGQPPCSEIADTACESWFLYHNVWADGYEYRQDLATLSQKNVWTLRNFFADFRAANAPNVRATGHCQNHNMNSSGFGSGLDWSLNGELATLFVDPAKGDFTPKGSNLFGRWDDPIAPFDAAGNRMPSDGSGAIGALQGAGVPGAEPVDATAPTVGAMVALAPFIRSGPLTLEYSGVTDSQSGVGRVELWARKGSGAWAATGLADTAASGAFSYSGFSGDDEYGFALRVTDIAGNLSPVPAGTGTVHTILDATEPVPGAISTASASATGPVELQYSGASDAGSGLKQVVLWFKTDAAGVWTDSGLTSTAASGSFNFVPPGDGNYSFCLQAEDMAGNVGAVPGSAAVARVTVDSAPPATGVLTVAPYSTKAPITLTYADVSDSGSGIKAITLWYAKGAAGVWTDSGLASQAAAGTFSFAPSGDGIYSFCLRAEDLAGNASAVPGATAVRTTLDSVAPSTGTLTVAPYSTKAPLTLTYSGVSDTGSGLKQVALWYAKDAGGSWVDSGLKSEAASGTFEFVPSGEGSYSFCLQAEDMAGNVSVVPGSATVACTTVDSTAPGVGTLTVAAYSTTAAINVAYSDVSDTGSGIKSIALWFIKDATGPWVDSGLRAQAPSGTFNFRPAGDGVYNFALQVEDMGGNKTVLPTGVGQCSSVRDSVPPFPGTLSAIKATKRMPLSVKYSGASDSLSGVKQVMLWMKTDTSAWVDTGLRSTLAPNGSFTVDKLGEGKYYFFIQAEDKAGLRSAAP